VGQRAHPATAKGLDRRETTALLGSLRIVVGSSDGRADVVVRAAPGEVLP
jgi:hypothetical protein